MFMKIKRIIIENNPILWSLDLDFCDQEWSIYNNVILIGENWSWKSTLMNIIYDFSSFHNPQLTDNEKRTFIVDLYDTTFENGEYSILFDKSYSNWIWWVGNHQDNIKVMFWNNNKDRDFTVKSVERNKALKSIFSDVSINFNAEVKSTTDKNIDVEIKDSQKSNENIAKDITQTLVDIYREDTTDLQERVDNNPGQVPPESVKLQRTKRFQMAFNSMFSDNNLEYKKVQNLKPIFHKNWNNIEINNLSSWEKQIVFRWWFLLKDKNSIKWALAIIDEPEISMHPMWQQKLLQFYKGLFTDETWSQTSQMFISTHSPYILQNMNISTDCIFIFPWGKRVDTIKNYIWNIPSLWVINYEAFNLPSIELHDELYWYIQDKTRKNKQKELEEYLLGKWIIQNKQLPDHWVQKPCTLWTFIRNIIHHQEVEAIRAIIFTQDEFKESINGMIDFIQRENL